MLIFSVKNLLSQPTGAKEEYPLKETLSCEEIPLKIPFTGQLLVRKLPGASVSAECYDVEASAQFSCGLCLKKYTEKVSIDHFEAQFYLNPPQGREIAEQYFRIDKKKLEIDLSELVRQELLLHFPAFPVCSKGCKGLCPHCGKNLNEGACHAEQKEAKAENPFSVLRMKRPACRLPAGRQVAKCVPSRTEGSRPVSSEKSQKKRFSPRNVVFKPQYYGKTCCPKAKNPET